ncbi:MarR family winged helix-turn-helix transcriptional regulator [Mycobacterium nebraskense]|uniref:MarR family transcriptional regulator n=1 Tax=Mycobacterium nebraskense TaxID=244292 RepID=A0A0F5NE71_9MYCO|nr:MarR family transcriptional regulator [Mycobacterium nebraskense]KKC05299.1 MarR family transcriptional regulator [Mycobacterium nebraskense]KLO47003.1 MarR family transcriptional regulator [Mycobacterium nebraskense]MBI2695799.1 MarR family transcriptional regulator [Mycobacterium nebraskense]MCV7119313.1 MarR family transcriptional regulator [Mycobacterium nebraskense]ORW18555.1 MarR family transcriptional regulator [Mycobacterium nebraskense]
MLHTVMEADEQRRRRDALEALISADLREMSTESDQIGRQFAVSHHLRPNDFRALMYIMVAETAGWPMTSGDLSQRMGLSGSAITYLVDRLIDSGHIRRDSHPDDRRKVILRHGESGLATARSFFSPLGAHTRVALEELPDGDLMAAHRVLGAVIHAMQRFRGELDRAGIDP